MAKHQAKPTMQSVPIESVTLDPNNARAHSDVNLAAITASLEAFGQVKPIVVDRADVVVAGNGLLAAARKLGWTEIKVVRFDGTRALRWLAGDLFRPAELCPFQ